MCARQTTTVGRYVVRRLEQAGVGHVFGVPGDYVLRFFDDLVASRMEVVCTCNELNAGYAADAYARLRGIGAVCVTYGVGGFSLLNAVVGAYAERVPLVVMSGAPNVAERRHQNLLHHTVGDLDLQRSIYERVTETTVVLTSPDRVPEQVDAAVRTCLRSKRPVYLEIPQDVVGLPCPGPGPLRLEGPHDDAEAEAVQPVLQEALDEAAGMLAAARDPVVVVGVEAHRFGLGPDIQALIDRCGYPYATSMLGKAAIPESHPGFLGVYSGALGSPEAQEAVEGADAVLSLGALMTDLYRGVGTARLDPKRMILANSDNVRIRHHLFPKVRLGAFVQGLRERLPAGEGVRNPGARPADRLAVPFVPEPGAPVRLSRFYDRVNRFLEPDHLVIADTGDSLMSASRLHLPEQVPFIAQAFYVSIGFSVPGALGVGMAVPDKRMVVFVGDGAFQMTAQELSSLLRHGLNPVVFLMNNDGYTIERVMHDGPYNDLHMWNYHQLPAALNGSRAWGAVVRTEGELEEALDRARSRPRDLAFVEVRLDRMDCSDALKSLGGTFRSKGTL